MSIASINAQTLAIAYDALRPGADGLVTPPPTPDAATGTERVAADETTPAPSASTTLGTLVDTYL